MRRTLLVAILLLCLPQLARADVRKFGLVLGNNLGHDFSRELRFAEHDARKFYSVLLELGGFRKGDLTLMLGADAGQVWKALRGIEKRIQEAPGDKLLLLYYSGHAEGDVLELGDSELQFDELSGFLKSSRADVRLAFVDSCQSGKLLAAKGGHRGHAFAIRVTEEIRSKGYAIITSSAENELSMESREIRGSFFTHYLVSALRGAGEGNQDGKVTLQEAYNYAYSRTVARTSKTVSGSQHPMYDFQLSGKGEVVLTRTGQASALLSVDGPPDTRLMILDEEETGVVAECEIPANRRAVMALSPGSYQVFLFTGDKAKRTKVRLDQGRQLRLAADDFSEHELEIAVNKGGLFRTAWRQQFGGGLILRRVPVGDADLAIGAGLTYRLESPGGLSVATRLAWTSAADQESSGGYYDLGAYAGIGYGLSLGYLRGRVEALLGYEHLFQDRTAGINRNSSGVGYLALVGLEAPLGNLVLGLEFGTGGRVFKLQDGEWVNRLDLQLVVGIGWEWGWMQRNAGGEI